MVEALSGKCMPPGVGGVAAHTHFHTLFLYIVSKTANQQVKKGGTKVDASDYSRFSVPVGITVKF